MGASILARRSSSRFHQVPWGAQLVAFTLVLLLLAHLLTVLLTDLTSPFWPQTVTILSQAIPGFLEPAMRSALVPAPLILLLSFMLLRGLKLGAVLFFLLALWEAVMLALRLYPFDGALGLPEIVTLIGTVLALALSLVALKSVFVGRRGGVFR